MFVVTKAVDPAGTSVSFRGVFAEFLKELLNFHSPMGRLEAEAGVAAEPITSASATTASRILDDFRMGES
jgi:hypothetical protein